MDVEIHVFLTSALVGVWSVSRPGRFTLVERVAGTHRIGGWVGARTCLNEVERRKSCIYRVSNSANQPVASRYNDCAIPPNNLYMFVEKKTNLIIICLEIMNMGAFNDTR
jgi:hypothetical protein